jgi:hypothetical protein
LLKNNNKLKNTPVATKESTAKIKCSEPTKVISDPVPVGNIPIKKLVVAENKIVPKIHLERLDLLPILRTQIASKTFAADNKVRLIKNNQPKFPRAKLLTTPVL